MCGIFGCILKEGNAAPLIHSSLKRLEYRGYDSVGIATIDDGKIFLKKDQGKIDEVHKILNLDDMPGNIRHWTYTLGDTWRTFKSQLSSTFRLHRRNSRRSQRHYRKLYGT